MTKQARRVSRAGSAARLSAKALRGRAKSVTPPTQGDEPSVTSEQFYTIYRGLVWSDDPKGADHQSWMGKAIHALSTESRLVGLNQLAGGLDEVLRDLHTKGTSSSARTSNNPPESIRLSAGQAAALAALFGKVDSAFTFASVLPVELDGYRKPPAGYMTQEDLAVIYGRLFVLPTAIKAKAGAKNIPEAVRKVTELKDIRAVHLAALIYLCQMRNGQDPLTARLEFARSLSLLAGKRSGEAFLITEQQAAWFVTLFIKRHDFQQIAPYPEGYNPRIFQCTPDGLDLPAGAVAKTGY